MASRANIGQRPGRRERLTKLLPLMLLAVPTLLAVSLWSRTPPSNDKALLSTDAVSLQYLQLWSRARPTDIELRLRLVRALLAASRYDEAAQVLESIPDGTAEQRLQVRLLRLEIHIGQRGRTPGGAPPAPELQHQLLQELEALLSEPLPSEQLTQLAAHSLRYGYPELAARIYQRLAVTQPQQRRKWLEAAAEQALAGGEPAVAGKIFEELAESAADLQQRRQDALRAINAYVSAAQADKALALAKLYAARLQDDPAILDLAAKLALANNQPGQAGHYYAELLRLSQDGLDKRRYAKLVLTALTATGQVDEALAAAGRFIEMFPGNLELLSVAVKLARAGNRTRLAQLWGRALLARNPNNPKLIAQQISIELAAGDTAAALELARRLIELQPDRIEPRERLAQISLWVGQPQTALEQWAYLALHLNYFKHLEPAIRMAPQLSDLETLAQLLALKARRGRLTNPQLISLVDTFEAIGEPEQLVGILAGYVERHPDHREAWLALADEHERRGDLKAALALLERIGRDFGSNLSLLMHQAELLNQLRQPYKAYLLLRDALDHAGVASTHELLDRVERRPRPARERPPQEPAPGSRKAPELTAEPRKAPELTAEQRKPLLKLLAETFWYSEPEPEAIEEYRHLWRQGALLGDSAARYVAVAKAQGLLDEAQQVSEEAYLRFGGAEFLLTAMDLAYRRERWDDLGRQIRLASQHPERFADDKNYFLTLAEYYTHQGEYGPALRAYLRVVALDPSLVAARADVLWLLIEHSEHIDRQKDKRNRRDLFRFLSSWSKLAKDEPTLWLPFATGWAMLGRSKEAVAFYQREWTRRPEDHLWLLGYAADLDSVSRSSDARRLRRYALTLLRPEALRAAHQGATPGEREVLRAYTELVREVYGVGKGSRWMSELWRRGLGPQVQRDLLAVWRANGEDAESSPFIRDSRTVSRTNPWGRFAKAPKRSQEQQVATIADPPADIGISIEEAEPAPAPLLVLEPDAAAGEDQIPVRAKNIGIEADAQNIDELIILATRVSALVARGAWAVGGHFGVNQLLFSGIELPPPSLTEIDLAAYGMWRHRAGRLEVGAAANLRSDANVFSGWLKESFEPWRGGTLNLGLHLNELTTDSPRLRLYGTRHHLDLSLHTSFLTDGLLNLHGSAYQYRTRTNQDLGYGFSAEGDIGYRIHRVRPLWTVRATASYGRNFASPITGFGPGTDLLASFGGDLPEQFASFGVGTHVEHRFPGIAPIGAGRWRYLGELWVGWLWPLNIVGFEARAGIGLALPRRQELSLTGFIANNRWLGPGVLNAGLGLRYSFR